VKLKQSYQSQNWGRPLKFQSRKTLCAKTLLALGGEGRGGGLTHRMGPGWAVSQGIWQPVRCFPSRGSGGCGRLCDGVLGDCGSMVELGWQARLRGCLYRASVPAGHECGGRRPWPVRPRRGRAALGGCPGQSPRCVLPFVRSPTLRCVLPLVRWRRGGRPSGGLVPRPTVLGLQMGCFG
jgi:hypothetical protein